MSEKLDPERVTEIMNQCFQRLGHIVQRCEGYIDKFMGDCVMVLFGAPIAHENDPELAVNCALLMIEELKTFNQDHKLDLGMSMGINSGLVIAGHVGSDQKLEYTVMGDTVNTAQRLQSNAGRNEIFVSKSVMKSCSSKFAFGPEILLQMKGKEFSVEAYSVLGLQSEPASNESKLPLVGRGAELLQIQGLIENLERKTGHILLLVGEPGIGKSRLKSEIRKQVREKSYYWLEAKCLSSAKETPYSPFLELLRSVLDIDAKASRSAQIQSVQKLDQFDLDTTSLIFLRDFLGLPFESDEPIRLEAAQRRLMLMTAMRSFLVKLAVKSPAVLYFEDLHWMDPLSVELLEGLMDGVESMPLVLAGGARPDFKHQWHERSHFSQIRLRPLTPAQATELVCHMLHLDSIPEALRLVIEKRSDGNPLYVEEIVKNIIDKGGLKKTDGQWSVVANLSALEMPTTLHGLIASRIDRLSSEEKQLLQVASVMGRTFDLDLLKKVYSHFQNLDMHLNALKKKGLVNRAVNDRGEKEYYFHHALTQEVAYQSILNKVRKDYHRMVAEILEDLCSKQGDQKIISMSGDLARHYLEAQVDTKAIHYLIINARKLSSNFENQGAIENYRRAIDLLEKHDRSKEIEEQLIDCYTQLALILALVGQSELAESYEYKVIEMADARQDWKRLSRTYRYLGDFQAKLGHFESSMKNLDRAMEFALKINDFESQIRTMKSIGNTCKELQQLDRARSVLEEGLAGARKLKNSRLSAEFLNDLATVDLEMRALDSAASRLQESISFTVNEPELKALFGSSTINLGCVCQYQGDLSGALSRYQIGGSVAAQIGDLKNLIIAKNNAAEVLLELKDYEQARNELMVTLKLAKEAKSHLGRVTASVMMGFLMTMTGHDLEGERLLIESMNEAAERKFWNFYCDALIYLSRHYQRSGRSNDAKEFLDRGLMKANELNNQLLQTRFHDEIKRMSEEGQGADRISVN